MLISIKSISLSASDLINLNDLPRMPNLKHLGLFGNNIGDSDTTKNKEILIKCVEMIKEKCPKLEELYIEENKICEIMDYEEILKKEIKTLKVLNGKMLSYS